MNQDLRNKLRQVVTQCRKLLEDDIRDALEGKFGIFARGEKVSVDRNAPMTHLSDEERRYRVDLIDHLASQGRVRMHLTLTPQRLPDTTGYNVVADIKGSEHPEQIVVVSGHLDSWDLGRGAIDDGAGVVISMATAEILQRLHIHPRRTLRVIAWMDEENGGGGHDAYARSHAAEMANHIAAIESDAGAGHPLGFSVKLSPAAIAALRPVMSVLLPVGSTALRPTSVSPGSDIEPLVDAGVPGLGIIQDGRKYFDYHHTPADTLDKVDPQELRENAAAMAVMGYALAAMPDPLPR